MDWCEGQDLKDFINSNIINSNIIENIAHEFLKMISFFHANDISHGDLQHGNIRIRPDNSIVVLDYDSMYIPELHDIKESIGGIPSYQHPSRFKSANKASLKVDYFSELIIYLSLCSLAKNPKLWNSNIEKKDDGLLFNEIDFENLQQSEIYKELSSLNSELINSLLYILVDYLSKSSYLYLEPFYKYTGFEKLFKEFNNESLQEKISSLKRQKNPIKKLYQKWQILSLVAVITLCLIIGTFFGIKPLFPFGNSNNTEIIRPFDSKMLIGDYTAIYKIDGQSDTINGYIEAISQNKYRITNYSDYDPESFLFIYNEETKTISSPDINIQEIKLEIHDGDFRQIKIIFKKGNQSWEFTKELVK
jgi:serine/threonine protein kinase